MKGGKHIAKGRAPKDLVLSVTEVSEDAAVGDVVGTLSATDSQGDALTFTLTNSAGGAFEIVGTSLKVAGALSYDEAPQMAVEIRVTDAAGNELDAVITITVTQGAGGGGGTPEWVPAGALAFADFVNGHYYAGGAETTAADTISDPSKIVSSSGLVFANGDNSQTVIGDFVDALLGTTATIVVEYEFTIGSALNPVMVANDVGDSQESFYTYVVNRTDTFAAAGHYSDPVYPPEVISTVVLASGVCRVAFTFSPTRVSLSANGESPAVTDATTIAAAATRVVIGRYAPDTPVSLSEDFVFRSITVYAPVADAHLPALSAIA